MSVLVRLLSVVLLLFFTNFTAADERPNIVLVMADDVGYGDISFYNERIAMKKAHVQTPTIDALAAQGIWFTDGHSPAALCSPSRYSVMSGNDPHRSYAPWGVWASFRKNAITEDDATLGRVAKAAGYTTGFVGKWHLGGTFYKKGTTTVYEGPSKGEATKIPDITKWIAGHPRELGFDYDFTVPTGVQGPLYLAYENSRWSPLSEDSSLIYMDELSAKSPVVLEGKGPGMGDSAWDSAMLNKTLANKARQFIHANAGKTPFLLTYWTPAVHKPYIPPKKWGDDPIAGTTVSAHLDMVRTLDKEVSTIVTALKSTGVYDNTLIIFTSDNGGLEDGIAQAVGHNSAGELRGWKSVVYEGGHRVPFIVSWAGHTPPGSQSNALLSGTDFVATIAALLDVPLKPDQAKDSWNFLPLINGEKKATGRTELMIQGARKKQLEAFRDGNWKLVLRIAPRLRNYEPIGLYDLSVNPQEDPERNLIANAEYEKRVKKMLKQYIRTIKSDVRTAPLL